MELRIKRKDGSGGPRVKRVTVSVGEPTEYKDLSKDGTGAFRKALKGHKGQIIYAVSTGGKKAGEKEIIAVRPIYAFESPKDVIASLHQKFSDKLRIIGLFQSGCLVEVDKPVNHTKLPLPPGIYLLNTIITDGNQIKITTAAGKTYPEIPKYNLTNMIAAGLRRVP